MFNDFKKLIDQNNNEKNCMIAGDVNSTHPSWNGNNKQNNRGNKLANIIGNSNLCILNDGNPTYYQIYKNYFNAIDITLSSIDLINNITWQVLEVDLGTDHLPIWIQINNCKHQKTNKTRINYKKVLEKINEVDTNTINDFDFDSLQQHTTLHTKIQISSQRQNGT